MPSTPLPIQDAPAAYDQETMNSILRAVEQRLQSLEQVKSTGWVLSNVTTDKTFDANGATIAVTDDVLGTLIQELIDAGVLAASS
jgi:hypothetical protein